DVQEDVGDEDPTDEATETPIDTEAEQSADTQPEATDKTIYDETDEARADTDIEEQPTDVREDVGDEARADEATETLVDTEAPDETTCVEDTEATEQSDNQSDLETYDYETSPETQDAVNLETSGEFVSAENPYREGWEKFGEEFSDDSETDGWDSLKDVPFSGEEQADTNASVEGSDTDSSMLVSGATDVDGHSDTSEINSISDYMNAHNYGPDDFATYSQDPQWRQLMRQEYPDFELPEMTQESANAQLSQYMNDHNYGVDDYEEYSQDPIWRELHSAAFPDDELPYLNRDVQSEQTDLDREMAMEKLSDFMYEHNYGPGDFEKYSQNPLWRKLQRDAYPTYDMPALTDKDALDLSKINMSNYDLGNEYQYNCQRCVPAYVAQQRGYDVQAKPILSNDDHLSKYPYDVYDHPDVITNSSQAEITSRMKDWGDGSVAQVVLTWKGTGGIDGHTFAAKQINGETRFFDPQNGDTDVSWYFDMAEPGSISFCRADNQKFSNRINDCVNKKEV
ncbi:MAG: hypothetical protein IJM14_05520, partial [Lachnospiraceae bacterium]|nr:hypothetical protein [Lachnospiraceae bacterium]